jgi:hypothetical protein
MRRLWIGLAGAIVVLAAIGAACNDDADEVPTATPPADATPTPEQRETVQVYFLDEERFATGEMPYVTPVEREVGPPVELDALDALFSGPTAEESAQGLTFVASEATGFTDFEIDDDGIARLQLIGGCDSGGSTFTVANHIMPTLTQFASISYVKIFDLDGETAAPDGPSDSIPACLEP